MLRKSRLRKGREARALHVVIPQRASRSQTHLRVLAAHSARALLFPLPPNKEGAGKAGCRLAPTVRCARVAQGEMHSGIQVKPNTRPSLRSGLTAYAVLSREPNSFWPPSPSELTMWLTRSGAPHLRKGLGRSDDGRDHTVLPYARSAVRLHVAADSQGLPALPAPPVPTLPRPPQPGPRFERLANRPSSWAGLFRFMPQFRISVKWNILRGGIDGVWRWEGVLPDGQREMDCSESQPYTQESSRHRRLRHERRFHRLLATDQV